MDGCLQFSFRELWEVFTSGLTILVFVHFFMVFAHFCVIFRSRPALCYYLLFPHRGFLRLHRVSIWRRGLSFPFIERKVVCLSGIFLYMVLSATKFPIISNCVIQSPRLFDSLRVYGPTLKVFSSDSKFSLGVEVASQLFVCVFTNLCISRWTCKPFQRGGLRIPCVGSIHSSA